jgi:hypothetical protein
MGHPRRGRGGQEAAPIKRVGNDGLGVGPQTQIIGNNLTVVADQLIARHKDRLSAQLRESLSFRALFFRLILHHLQRR